MGAGVPAGTWAAVVWDCSARSRRSQTSPRRRFSPGSHTWALSGEVSYRPDFPVQINTTEILQGAVGLAPWSTVTPIILEDAAINGWGNAISGFDRLPVTQAQVTFIRFFDHSPRQYRRTLLTALN